MTEIDLGPVLTPPRDGLLRLQRRVQMNCRHRARGKPWLAAAVAAGVAAIAFFVWSPDSYQQRRIDGAVKQVFRAPPRTHFSNGAYLEVASGQADVRIILVASLPRSQADAGRKRR